MSINLALILVVLTAVSGVVVAFNRFYYAERAGEGGGHRALAVLIEYSRSFFPVLLFVLVIRSFLFEPFRIPSKSMVPTLLQGDYIFVKKYAYGLRWPVIEQKFFETGSPERGDVVVFRLPSDPNINYIKRVIGLPGDRVEYVNHQLTVNGVRMPLRRDGADESSGSGLIFIETLGEREHEIRVVSAGRSSRVSEWVVPEGQYFVMGDNRDNSSDSRVIGTIPETHLVGEAVRVWMHMDGLEWPDWGRIGTKIQ